MRLAAVVKIRSKKTLWNSMGVKGACVRSTAIKFRFVARMRNLIRAIGGILNRIFALRSIGGATLGGWIVERAIAQARSGSPGVPDAEFSKSYANQAFED
jgi:hypothetical protein